MEATDLHLKFCKQSELRQSEEWGYRKRGIRAWKFGNIHPVRSALSSVLPICVCDLTPGTCDVNCCCDKDCYLPHPRTVFSFCLPGSVR